MTNINLRFLDNTFPEPPKLPQKNTSQLVKVGAAITAVVSVVLIILGALGIAGGASLGLLATGSVALCIVAIGIIAVAIKGARAKLAPPKESEEEKALKFAREYLEANKSKAEGYKHIEGIAPPANPSIPLLSSLVEQMRGKYNCFLKQALEASPDQKQAILDKVNATALQATQLSYAVSSMTLCGISSYRRIYPQFTTDLEVVTSRDAYYSQVICDLSATYYLVRFIVCFPGALSKNEEEKRVARFYQSGTPEYQMRELYNSFCFQASEYFGDALIYPKTENEKLLTNRLVPDNGPEFKIKRN
ncbi:hypothetical protein [Chlamydia vaughanii]|uniref:hypothetical protein n=1 Tax=Chlamydia vaughanii TaxID=3112552 RepID=UPI0032B18A1F